MNNKKYIPYKVKSTNRENGTPINDTTIYLHSLDTANENYDIHMRNFTINNDFFNVNANNNVLSLSFDTNLGITSPPIIQDTPITLSIQNYNTTAQFITGFNTQAGIAGVTGLTATFNDQTNLFTFHNSLGPTQVFNWDVQENQKFLGLSSGTHILGTTLLSDKTADLSGPDEINILLENIDLEAYNTTDYNKNILSTIPIETRFNEKKFIIMIIP